MRLHLHKAKTRKAGRMMRQFDSDPAVLFEGDGMICEAVTNSLAGGRADAVAASLFGMSRSGAKRLITEGNIFLLSPSD